MASYRIIGVDGREYGPVSDEQIRQWIREGRSNAQTRILLEGGFAWTTIGELPEFSADVAQKVPPAFVASSPLPSSASAQVNGPAIGLIVVAVLNLITSIAAIIMTAAGGLSFTTPEMSQQLPGWYFGLNIGSNILGLLLSGFIIYGGLKMRQLQNYGVALAASIIAAVPCTSPCCLVGLPIGIWAIVVLVKPEVKQSFS